MERSVDNIPSSIRSLPINSCTHCFFFKLSKFFPAKSVWNYRKNGIRTAIVLFIVRTALWCFSFGPSTMSELLPSLILSARYRRHRVFKRKLNNLFFRYLGVLVIQRQKKKNVLKTLKIKIRMYNLKIKATFRHIFSEYILF